MFELTTRLTRYYKGTEDVALSKIELPEFYDRFEPDEEHVEKLRESIERHGQLVPIWCRVVTEYEGKEKKKESRYVLIAGRHRLEALKKSKLKKVRVDLFDVDEEKAAMLSTIENEHRKQRNSIERINALVHHTMLGWHRALKENNIPYEKELAPNLSLQAGILLQNYLKYGRENTATSHPSIRLLINSFKETCESFVVSEMWAAKQLMLFDLPPAVMKPLREEKLSLKAGIETSRWYKKIRGRRELPEAGTRGKEREDAIREFINYVIEELPDSERVRKKGEQILSRISNRSSSDELKERFLKSSDALLKKELSPRTALAVDKLLKKIEKLLEKG